MASTTPTGDVNIAGGTVNLPVASTVDAVNDFIPIYTASATATQAINRNNYLGLASAPVGLTDTQSLTNKTLTSPTISGPTFSGTLIGTYTIGGTPTFPASVVTLTGTQVLTNKTLTSPTINSPTITNANITADALTGFTNANNGTLYGISVAASVITTAGSVGSGANVTNGVQAAALAINAIKLGYAKITSNTSVASATLSAFGTPLGVTVTVPSGGRDIKITVAGGGISHASAGISLSLVVVESGTPVGDGGIVVTSPGTSYLINPTFVTKIAAPSAGSHTYNVYGAAASGTLVITAGASFTAANVGPMSILVEAI